MRAARYNLYIRLGQSSAVLKTRRLRMRKIGTEKTDARSEAGDSKEPMVSSAVIKRNWRPLLVMGVIMFLATFVRVFFAYGVSAGSDFALSGGTAASNNLMALDNLLSDGLVSFVNESLYYPYGSTSVVPMVFTFILYPFALIANAFMHVTTAAASFALALSLDRPLHPRGLIGPAPPREGTRRPLVFLNIHSSFSLIIHEYSKPIDGKSTGNSQEMAKNSPFSSNT